MKNEIEDTFDPFNSSSCWRWRPASPRSSSERRRQAQALRDRRRAARRPAHLHAHVDLQPERTSLDAPEVRSARPSTCASSEPGATRGDKNEKEPSKQGVDTTAYACSHGEAWPTSAPAARGAARHRALRAGVRLPPVIEGCEEGWTVADELGRAGASPISSRAPAHAQGRALHASGRRLDRERRHAPRGRRAGRRAPRAHAIDTIGTPGATSCACRSRPASPCAAACRTRPRSRR
jgi:hypothetical protein